MRCGTRLNEIPLSKFVITFWRKKMGDLKFTRYTQTRTSYIIHSYKSSCTDYIFCQSTRVFATWVSLCKGLFKLFFACYKTNFYIIMNNFFTKKIPFSVIAEWLPCSRWRLPFAVFVFLLKKTKINWSCLIDLRYPSPPAKYNGLAK